jgi:hypothetical protein
MSVRKATAALLSAVALLMSGCTPDESKDSKVNALFSELMQRPDIETMQTDYLAMLEQLRNKLIKDVGIAPFIPDPDGPVTGSGCPGDFSAVPDAMVLRFRSGRSPGNISDAEWPRALKLVTDFLAERGFGAPKAVVDKPGDHEVAIYDQFGAELIFGTAANTILSLSTGCHLSRAAHQRGTPEDKPLY